ncbi:HpcH/HpaI aldolase/citrate lyase family protein [Kibdelosporangium phytohabitans]|uniref:HpcH/HpaI aldolase/citrate lyase family protein n=1 Tax=Kibdelosporangium phytohabitans TaxID=860235 RepID=UPI000B2B281C|nr:citrate lyase subunit beta/citryl-CoA lyase [Kibdelosporangium phytohabitans]
MTTLASARTFAFVPGHRPDRFARAMAAGADVVVIDLEDAVARADKVAARENVRAWLQDGHEVVVRVNPIGSPWYGEDVDAVAARARAPMLPKAEDPGALAALPGETPVIPLIESATGIARAAQVCAVASVVRPAFGSVDLATQLGANHRSRNALLHARSALVLAAASAGCAPPIDGVITAIDEPAALADDLRHAGELGFTGKSRSPTTTSPRPAKRSSGRERSSRPPVTDLSRCWTARWSIARWSCVPRRSWPCPGMANIRHRDTARSALRALRATLV